MTRIAGEAEASIRSRGYQDPPHPPIPRTPRFWRTSPTRRRAVRGASAIVVFTSTGSSARLVSRYRPPVSIFAITPHNTTAQQLAVNYGVVPDPGAGRFQYR